MDKKNEFPSEAVAKMGKLGLMGIPCPSEWDGLVWMSLAVSSLGATGESCSIGFNTQLNSAFDV